MSLFSSVNSTRDEKFELYVNDKKVYSGTLFDIYGKFCVKNNLLWNEIKDLDCTCIKEDGIVKFYVKTTERKLLSHNLYGGKSIFFKGAVPYELETRTCGQANFCSLYQNGSCASLKRLSGCCKYVATGVEKGSYNSQKGRAIRDKYYELKEENPNLLDFDGHFFAVGDEYAFNLVFAKIVLLSDGKYKVVDCNSNYYNKNNSTVIGGGLGWTFIPKEAVTKEFMEGLFSCRPHTLFSFEKIEKYQEQIVPRIKIDIVKFAPELAEKIGLENVNYVGKLGLIKTLKPNITIMTKDKKHSLYWNGETVTILNPENLFLSLRELGSFKEAVIKFVPNEKTYGIIEDNSWVLPKTIIKEL